MKIGTSLKSSVADHWIRRTPGIYGAFRNLLTYMQRASLADRRTKADAFLVHALATASRTRYGKLLENLSNYSDWPVLEKHHLRDQPDLFIRKSIWPKSHAATGGTSGIPVNCLRSWRSVVFEQATIDYLSSLANVDWGTARLAILRAETIKDPSDPRPPFWRYQRKGLQLSFSSHHLTTTTIADYLRELQRFQPEILWVYPSSLEAFCRLLPEDCLDLPTLKLVFSSSEVLSPEMSALARTKLNATLIDHYGQAERVCASFSMQPNEHFFLPAYGHVELDFSYREGIFDYYEIIGTSYWNSAQPLVRYRTGDHARLPKDLTPEELDEICLGVRPFIGVVGRQTDFLVSPQGIHLLGMNHIPRGIPNVVQMQFHQTRTDSVAIHVVPLPGYSAATEALILEQARQKIPESMAIDIRCVDRLYRTTRGKAPLIVRHITI